MFSVGLDCRPTESGFKAHYGRGTGRYTQELVRHLLESSKEAADNGLRFVPVGGAELGASGWEQSLLQFAPAGKVTLETQFVLPRRVQKLGVDAVHFFAHGDAPANLRLPYFITVLDLIPLRFPDLYRAAKPNWRFRFARYLEHQAIAGASGIFAISECTKRDVVEFLGVAPEKIVVTPLAVDERFTPIEDSGASRPEGVQKLRKKFSLSSDKPVLLYVGGIDPRKNVHFLLELVEQLRSQTDLNAKLVMVGAYESDDCYPALIEDIKRRGLLSDVELLGFVADEDLPDIYRMADITLFPSLYEGFGFPVLESMASGTPVLAANNSSIPEVVGSKDLLLPDNDAAAWSHAIKDLLGDQHRWQAVSDIGIERATQFSWEHTAKLTAEGYAHFLQSTSAVCSGGEERNAAAL